MLASVALSGQALGLRTCSKPVVSGLRTCSKPVVSGLSLTLLPSKTCQMDLKNMNSRKPWPCIKKMTDKKPKYYRMSHPVMLSMSNSSVGFSPLSPSDTIKQFYTSINDKNLKQLRESISDDCFFDDSSFYKPFQGKKEVVHFLEQLIASMGQNLEFKVGLVCQGDDYTAGVTWRLEWKKIQIPFGRGCSFCKCSKEGSTLVIKDAQVITESPLKPGGLVLTLLTFVTTQFDAYPEHAERFLKSPHFLLQLFVRIYNVALRPFINPILGFYIKTWNFMARLLIHALNILIYISKTLQK